MTAEVLSIDGLSVTLATPAGPLAAVDACTLSVRAGRTLGLVGESGSGKTQTALSVLRLNEDGAGVRVDGRIRLLGEDVGALGEAGLRRLRGRRVGMIFQDPSVCLNPLLTVGTQIAEAMTAHGEAGAAARSRTEALLAEVGLPDAGRIRRAYPHELSGGQQQRAMIAMALACDPALLVADEPTTALDVTVEAQVLDLLRRLQRDRGMAMLFISHDLAVVARVAHDVAVMRAGRIVESGPVADVLRRPSHPYTRSLLDSRPALGETRHRLPTAGAPGGEEGRAAPKEAAAARAPVRRTSDGGSEILSVEDLHVTYGRGRRAVRAVDGVRLRLDAGRTLGLVGESGSGKSTIARAIAGLVPVGRGTVRLFGGEPAGPDRPLAVRRRCQVVFQDTMGALNPRHRVATILAEPLEVHGLHPGRARRAHLERLIAEVGLEPEHLERYPRELSGGQRQRVNIARALAVDPDLVLCDEITSALDVSVQARILNLLRDIQDERGLSLVVISHDLGVVSYLADTVAVLRHGRLVETGACADVLSRPRDAYTRALLDAVPVL